MSKMIKSYDGVFSITTVFSLTRTDNIKFHIYT